MEETLSPSISESFSSNGQQIQKRKRVTRACDECRKRKVKCDGQQPCIHCTVYSYNCTFDQPSNRKKNVAELHLLETKLKNAEHILHLILPNLDVLDANFNYELFEEVYNKHKTSFDGLEKISLEYNNKIPSSTSSSLFPTSASTTTTNSNPSDVDTPTHSDLHVTKSEPNNSNTNSIVNTNTNGKVSKENSDVKISKKRQYKKPKLNIPHPNIDGSIESKDGREIKIILPPKNIALELVTKMWASPCVLFRFYHRPSFIEDLDELYETDPENYTNKQNRFLPLAYSVMAVGALFSKKSTIDDKLLEDEGYKYFVAARKLIDITDARDIYAIQTIVTLILFLQCSARLSTCYSYIGVALRSALREGLHRKADRQFNPIEAEVRKRIFWTIYKMDIYVNTMLGLPRSIAPEDIDQEFPIESDDDNITQTGYIDQQPGKLSSIGIANKHTDLILIMDRIVKKLYPIQNNHRFIINHERVSEMELELRSWLSHLPKELIPGYDPPFQYYKANRMLHLSFLHVQIVLYRPFIHYISPKYTNDNPNIDQLSIQRAKNCISVARTCVKLAQDMINKNMLSGSYWFSTYTIFFSVACLVYYIHEVPFDEYHPDYVDIKRDAETGKKILTLLKDSSISSSRIYNILNSLFEQLNRRTATAYAQRQYQQKQPQSQPQQQQQQQQQQQHQQQRRQSYQYQPPQQQSQQEFDPRSKTSQYQLPDYLPMGPQAQPILSKSKVKLQSVPIAQNLVATNPNPYPFTTGNNNGQGLSSINNSNSDLNFNIKLEENVNDFDHLANFDSFINQPTILNTASNQATTTTSNNDALTDASSINNINSNDNNNKNSATSTAQDDRNQYVPGIIDQLDMQIFGRFLPPYMLKRPDGQTGPGAKGGDLPLGLQSTINDDVDLLQNFDPDNDDFQWVNND